ncbi:MAG TPA: TorF family putative porin [Pseudomonadales bacterium]|nr:TorF family putative porin [Pseudomonadales bacterium]HNC69474.1 TorF family putative porin [Pseudomonadales bacterium]HND14488.1 TorF family putative porin [Pseudomonadales bacterium]
MQMKAILALAAATLAMTGAHAHAGNYTGNVTLATDYVFRGVSQTQERPAIQGGFDAAFDNGIYAGVWASNVDFGTDASTELDFYGGYAARLSCSSCSYKIGVAYYRYDGDPQFDYVEAMLAFTWGGLTAGLNWSPEYVGDSATDALGDEVELYYPYLNYAHPLPFDLTLSLHVAMNLMSEKGLFEPGEDEYTEWSIGLGKSVGSFSFALTYWDSTIEDLYGVDSSDADARVVFSVGRSL